MIWDLWRLLVWVELFLCNAICLTKLVHYALPFIFPPWTHYHPSLVSLQGRAHSGIWVQAPASARLLCSSLSTPGLRAFLWFTAGVSEIRGEPLHPCHMCWLEIGACARFPGKWVRETLKPTVLISILHARFISTSDPREGQKTVQEMRVRSDRWGGGREMVTDQPARKWKESVMHLLWLPKIRSWCMLIKETIFCFKISNSRLLLFILQWLGRM